MYLLTIRKETIYNPYGSFYTFAVFRMQSMFFWEFTRRLKYKGRRFGTQCRFHRPGRSGINGEAKPSQAKVLTGGGDLREAQVDVPLSASHSCV